MAEDLDRIAVDDVARAILGHVMEQAMQGDLAEVDWADYEHLTEDQWEQVKTRINGLLNQIVPSNHEFVAAYERLTGETP